MANDNGGLPIGPVLVIIGILIIVAIGLIAWTLLNQSNLKTHDLASNTSPGCLQIPCPSGTTKINYQLNPTESPSTADFETINYCTVNAPPTSFSQALQICASGSGSTPGSDTSGVQYPLSQIPATQVTAFANFYNNNYLNTCGYNWKSQPIAPNPGLNPDPASLTYPDATSGYLIGCANILGLGNDPNVSAIKTVYCQACKTSNNSDPSCASVCGSS